MRLLRYFENLHFLLFYLVIFIFIIFYILFWWLFLEAKTMFFHECLRWSWRVFIIFRYLLIKLNKSLFPLISLLFITDCFFLFFLFLTSLCVKRIIVLNDICLSHNGIHDICFIFQERWKLFLGFNLFLIKHWHRHLMNAFNIF